MSNFTCKICQASVTENEHGEYITGCYHYPVQVFVIGDYEIVDVGYNQDLWIMGEGGEGGQFNREKFAEAVSQFYSDNF